MNFTFENCNEYDIKVACLDYGFRASSKFWNASQDRIIMSWNGIGGKGGLRPPQTAYGLNMQLPSAPHDLDFDVGLSWKEFFKANEDYLYNNYQVIDKESVWCLKWLRKRRMWKYYLLVELYGDAYFWTEEKLYLLGLTEPPPKPEHEIIGFFDSLKINKNKE